eukprot:scaffold187_cov329-Pavlova_lutheri.AAC.8
MKAKCREPGERCAREASTSCEAMPSRLNTEGLMRPWRVVPSQNEVLKGILGSSTGTDRPNGPTPPLSILRDGRAGGTNGDNAIASSRSPRGEQRRTARCNLREHVGCHNAPLAPIANRCYKASVKDVGHTVCSWKLRPLTKWRRFLLLWGGAFLVGESGVRPLFGSAVPPPALGETWSAASLARKVLMARENPWERRRGRRGVKQVLLHYMLGRPLKSLPLKLEGFVRSPLN